MIPLTHRLAVKYPQVRMLIRETQELRERLRKARKKMVKWEYCVVTIAVPNHKVHALLNDYGNDGWQLTAITQEAGRNVAWFKKVKTHNIVRPRKDTLDVSHSGTLEGEQNG